MNVLTFDASLFEDKYYKKRLSSRYAVDNNLYQQTSYEELCKAFFAVCPNLVSIDPSKHVTNVNSFLALGNFTRKMAAWCSEHCEGYWMNANFPHEVCSRLQANMLNRYWSFQDVNEAVMFKLAFC